MKYILYPIVFILFIGCPLEARRLDSKVIYINKTDYYITIYHVIEVPPKGRKIFHFGRGRSDDRVTKDNFNYEFTPKNKKQEIIELKT